MSCFACASTSATAAAAAACCASASVRLATATLSCCWAAVLDAFLTTDLLWRDHVCEFHVASRSGAQSEHASLHRPPPFVVLNPRALRMIVTAPTASTTISSTPPRTMTVFGRLSVEVDAAVSVCAPCCACCWP